MTLERYKQLAFWPMVILAIVFLFDFCASNFHLAIVERHTELFSYLDTTIYVLFVADYVCMLLLAEHKTEFFKQHLGSLVVVVFPFLRVMRLARLVTLLTSVVSRLKSHVMLSLPIYIASLTSLFVLIAASAVYDAEYQAVGANIRTPEDACWWSVVTIFTVGYGDRFPVTTEGRLYGLGLMVCGVAIVGSVSATFAGWLVGHIREVESENARIHERLDALDKKLTEALASRSDTDLRV